LAQDDHHLGLYGAIHGNRPIYFLIDCYIKPDDGRLGPKRVAYW